jgi:glutathione synthase/RimK-type ligase-like ATP-grasp enzyme
MDRNVKMFPKQTAFQRLIESNFVCSNNLQPVNIQNMKNLVVVDQKSDWQIKHPDIQVVTAKEYIKNTEAGASARYRVFNLCRSYNYQKLGYYVTLIASARGHKPQPSLTAIEDFKSPSMISFVSKELDELIQKSLKKITSDQFLLSVYFGKNVAKCYDRLSAYLFQQFRIPFLRAKFTKMPDGWNLVSIRPLSLNQIPEEHLPFANEQALQFLTKRKMPQPNKVKTRYDLGILINPEEHTPPSDKRAIQKFIKAAELLGVNAEIIQEQDIGRVAEFDALFIRETTQVNHHTYRFARRALANGLVVIDDPLSILRCCNKVYLYELLERHKIPIPKTVIIDVDNFRKIAPTLDYPAVLKQPDSAFSKGVIKVSAAREFIEQTEVLLKNSDLILCQEYMPTEYDWRIGVLDGKPLYCCLYYMVKNHWQICRTTRTGKMQEGSSEGIPLEKVPEKVLELAVKASKLIGDGLYGVDIKEVNGKFFVIEVNDNPSLDAGHEDALLKDELYRTIISSIVKRLDDKNSKIRKETKQRYARVSS